MKVPVAVILLALVVMAHTAAAQEPIRISLERTACFGACPVYSVELRGDGGVSYSGRQNVRVAGARAWRIDPGAVLALAGEMEKAGFFAMRDEYTAPVMDLPTTYTSLTIGPRSKRVKDRFGAPAALKQIEARIVEVAGVLGYVQIDAAARRMDEALAAGDTATVKALLAEGMNPRGADAAGVTLVMKAAAGGHVETVRAVLAAGGDPTARDVAGRNAADRVRDLLARDPGNTRLAAILRLLTDE